MNPKKGKKINEKKILEEKLQKNLSLFFQKRKILGKKENSQILN